MIYISPSRCFHSWSTRKLNSRNAHNKFLSNRCIQFLHQSFRIRKGSLIVETHFLYTKKQRERERENFDRFRKIRNFDHGKSRPRKSGHAEIYFSTAPEYPWTRPPLHSGPGDRAVERGRASETAVGGTERLRPAERAGERRNGFRANRRDKKAMHVLGFQWNDDFSLTIACTERGWQISRCVLRGAPLRAFPSCVLLLPPRPIIPPLPPLWRTPFLLLSVLQLDQSTIENKKRIKRGERKFARVI